MRYQFLPPYSPDFNPIEPSFSAIKAHIRRNGSLVRATMVEEDDTDVYLQLHEAVFSITADDAKGWFHHCNYI
jgi:hypothetical protein